MSAFITDKQTLIDHFYTNLAESEAKSHILETFLLKHFIALCALNNCFH